MMGSNIHFKGVMQKIIRKLPLMWTRFFFKERQLLQPPDSLDNPTLPKGGPILILLHSGLRKEFAPPEVNSFLYELILLATEANMKRTESLPLKNVLIHFNGVKSILPSLH